MSFSPQLIVWALLALLNIITFCVYGYDKRASKTGKAEARVSEKTLLLAALFFGSLGALLGMLLFHHKTKHAKFCVLVPLFLVLHVVIFVLLITGGILA